MSNHIPGCRVLVVEDEMIVSWALEDMLADLGCQIVGPAARISQALIIVDTQIIDIAILDVNLNGQKSYPVADALIARGVPFVFSTGYDRDGLSDAFKVYPMLQKPYRQADLSAALERLLVKQAAID